MNAARTLHQLILGAFIGATVGFAAFTAPALFSELTPAQAGNVVRRVVGALETLAMISSPLLLALAWRAEGAPKGRARLRAVAVLGIGLLGAVSAFVVSARLAEIRESFPDLSSLPKDHPERRAFGQLHGVSTALMGLQLLLGVGAFTLPPGDKSRQTQGGL
jgi:hypothetical protein